MTLGLWYWLVTPSVSDINQPFSQVLDNKSIGYLQAWVEQKTCSLSSDMIPVEYLMVNALKTVCLSADSNSIDSVTLEIIIPGDDTPFRRKTKVINLKSRNP